MSTMMRDRLDRVFRLTDQLAASVDDGQLTLRNRSAPSNSIGGQFWCIVGARESYARAFVASEWDGFSCSLTKTGAESAQTVRKALASSGGVARSVVEAHELTNARASIVFDLIEHEALHHGQLIRYFYANAIPFPKDFAARYHLAQPKRTVP